MPSVKTLFARRNVVDAENVEVDQDLDNHRKTINMLISILSLVFLGLVLVTCLLYIRRVRQQRRMLRSAGILPTYADATQQPGAFTIQTTDKHGQSSVLVISRDGQPMLANPRSPPHAPDNVPQIRITFPDEQDDAGRMKNGRVVVVRMGEATVGLEPVKNEQLPAYEKENNSQFYSIDMNQIGGLKEKSRDEFK
jgi:hypothetical protein